MTSATTQQKPAKHFFIGSVYEWKVTETLAEAIQHQKRFAKEAGRAFIIYVPLPIEAKYEINFYAPQVENSIMLSLIDSKGKEVVSKG